METRKTLDILDSAISATFHEYNEQNVTVSSPIVLALAIKYSHEKLTVHGRVRRRDDDRVECVSRVPTCFESHFS